MAGSWVAAALILVPLVPLVLLIILLNRRDPKPPTCADGDHLNVDDPRFDQMNNQGLGWGTRDNDQGGL